MKNVRLKKIINHDLFNQLAALFSNSYNFVILDSQEKLIYTSCQTIETKDFSKIIAAVLQTKTEFNDTAATALPILIDQECIGLIICENTGSPGEKFKNFAKLLQTLITELAVKEAAKKSLIDEALDQYKEINILYQLSQTLAKAFDLDTALNFILTESIKRIQAESGFIFFTDVKLKNITIKSCKETKLTTDKTLELLTIFKPWIKLALDNYQKNELTSEIINEIKNNPPIKSLIYSLFKRDNNNFGLVVLINKKDNGIFTAQNIKFLNTVASQAAFAINNIELLKQLIHSEKLSTIGRLTSTIIHDIKNPLFVIKSFAEFLTNPNLKAEKRDQYLKTIISEFDRLLSMTTETLEFTKGEMNLEKKEWDFSEIINSTYDLLKHDFETKKKILKLDNPFNKKITADANKIKRVFFNVADNAKDALPEGGLLEIIISEKNNSLNILFKDNGKGMPEEIKDKIFEPFFTSGKKQGTGLGMPIVKKIIEAHKGTISFESQVGKGTTFSITLPISG